MFSGLYANSYFPTGYWPDQPAAATLLALAITESSDVRYQLTETSRCTYTFTDSTTTRWAIALGTEAVVTTSSSYLWLTEDQEFEVTLTRKNATTGLTEAATGLTGLTFTISATKGGSTIGSLSFSATERGTTGIYAATADTATLTTGLTTSAYPENSTVYLVLTKSGDVASRSWKKIVRRQREGDG